MAPSARRKSKNWQNASVAAAVADRPVAGDRVKVDDRAAKVDDRSDRVVAKADDQRDLRVAKAAETDRVVRVATMPESADSM
jgi:hypothetical protein